MVDSIINGFVPRDEIPCVFRESNGISRICGAWVGVLPKLVQAPHGRYDNVLSLAVETLSSCITRKPYAQNILIYTTAIEAVRTDIKMPAQPSNAVFAAAIMCLTLAEVGNSLISIHFNLSC